MAFETARMSPAAGTKRAREDEDDDFWPPEEPYSKKSRGSAGIDSVINTPTTSAQHANSKYDSDDQSSMISEPGSPQDIDSSGEDMDTDMDDVASYSQACEDHQLPHAPYPMNSSPWARRMEARNRVATPFSHPRAGITSIHVQTGFKRHIRDRHSQENMSSDHLVVPSPIDEDEVPTPPSAADAAGSQLSMLSVNDMDIETADHLPSITIDPARNLQLDGRIGDDIDSAMDSGPERGIWVRKQRQRSGAQSNGSVSPVRLIPTQNDTAVGAIGRRGITIGYRADCEKCRNRVPGHMNHFVS
jgi:hypothetical protein